METQLAVVIAWVAGAALANGALLPSKGLRGPGARVLAFLLAYAGWMGVCAVLDDAMHVSLAEWSTWAISAACFVVLGFPGAVARYCWRP